MKSSCWKLPLALFACILTVMVLCQFQLSVTSTRTNLRTTPLSSFSDTRNTQLHKVLDEQKKIAKFLTGKNEFLKNHTNEHKNSSNNQQSLWRNISISFEHVPEKKRFLPTFEEAIRLFPWKKLGGLFLSKEKPSIADLDPEIQLGVRLFWWKILPVIINVFSPYVEIEPIAKNDENCVQDKDNALTKIPENLTDFCEKGRIIHHGAFTGKSRLKPAKIVDLFIFGFDLDVLEVRLTELNSVVDYFVVMENIYTSKGHEKPLVLKQNLSRFQKFRSKLFRLNLSGSEIDRFAAECRNGYKGEETKVCWNGQNLQRKMLLKEFIRRNEENNTNGLNFDNDVVVMSGDLDELPSADRLKYLKYCEPAKDILGWIGHAYPGRLDKIMKFPDNGYQDQYGIKGTDGPRTMIYSYKVAKTLQKPPFQKKDNSKPPVYLWGMWHLTDHSYLPFQMVKLASFGEGPNVMSPWPIYQYLMQGDVTSAQSQYWLKFRVEGFRNWMVDAEDLPSANQDLLIAPQDLPIFFQCNPERLPTWNRRIDKRYTIKPKHAFYIGDQSVDVINQQQWLNTIAEMINYYQNNS